MEESIYRLRHRDLLTLCVLSLLFIGVVMVQSAAMNITGETHWQWNDRGMRHLIYAAFAIGTYFLVGSIDYRRLVPQGRSLVHNPIVWATAAAALTCVLVLVPGLGIEKNGARRWLPLGPVQVQPSELIKWACVVFLAWWLTFRPVDLNRFFKGFVPTCAVIGAMCLLVVIQDFGTAALIGLCSLTMLLAGRVRWWHLMVTIPPALIGAAMFIIHEPYRMRRLMSFRNPWEDPMGEGYHMVQSLLSFSTGGIMGKGLGNGVQKLGYLPEDTTDFIFAVICEELGFFGAMLVIVLYLGILYVAWQVVKQQKRDSFGRILAFGVGAMIGLQAMINIAVATVSVPTKGLSLPLISAGGSGLIITCAALGLLHSTTRYIHPPEPEQSPAPAAPAPQPRPVSDRLWQEFTIAS